jgi:hypothetical protein
MKINHLYKQNKKQNIILNSNRSFTIDLKLLKKFICFFFIRAHREKRETKIKILIKPKINSFFFCIIFSIYKLYIYTFLALFLHYFLFLIGYLSQLEIRISIAFFVWFYFNWRDTLV